MSRRRQATKRPLAKDGKYQNTLVSRLVNTVMFSGKEHGAAHRLRRVRDHFGKESGEQSH